MVGVGLGLNGRIHEWHRVAVHISPSRRFWWESSSIKIYIQYLYTMFLCIPVYCIRVYSFTYNVLCNYGIITEV